MPTLTVHLDTLDSLTATDVDALAKELLASGADSVEISTTAADGHGAIPAAEIVEYVVAFSTSLTMVAASLRYCINTLKRGIVIREDEEGDIGIRPDWSLPRGSVVLCQRDGEIHYRPPVDVDSVTSSLRRKGG